MSFRSVVTVFVVMGVLGECSLALSADGQSPPNASAVKIEKIAVMPFFTGLSGHNATEMLDSPASGFYFDQENISIDAAQVLTRQVQEALIDHHGTGIISLKESTEVYDQLREKGAREAPRALAQRLGKQLKVGHVMIGTVWRYRDRIGGSYGVERPASVAFAVFLIDVSNGKLLWTENFEETQRSLSENLLAMPTFLKRRGQWLSARELAEYGIDGIFSRYPF